MRARFAAGKDLTRLSRAQVAGGVPRRRSWKRGVGPEECAGAPPSHRPGWGAERSGLPPCLHWPMPARDIPRIAPRAALALGPACPDWPHASYPGYQAPEFPPSEGMLPAENAPADTSTGAGAASRRNAAEPLVCTGKLPGADRADDRDFAREGNSRANFSKPGRPT